MVDTMVSMEYLVNMSQIQDAIRAAVDASDKTRYRMAKDLGISQATISRFMSGERGLGIETLERLAAYLNLEIIFRPKRRRRKAGR